MPQDATLLEALALALGQAGQLDLAVARLRAAPSKPRLARAALHLLTRHGRLEEAAEFEEAVAAAYPADLYLLESRVARLHAAPVELLAVADAVLSHAPGAAHGIYYKAVALAQLERNEEAAALMALDRFVDLRRLDSPEDFAGDAEFLSTVAEEIRTNPTLHTDPVGHATRKGWRTRVFPEAGDRASTALTLQMRDAVRHYAEALAGDHPFVRSRPEQARFTAWALLMGADGHQTLHYHPERWLTGVFYVAAPPTHLGVLRLGVLPDWAGVEPPWDIIDVEPVPGRLVLFPSFVPHVTFPTRSNSERISVAFDVSAMDPWLFERPQRGRSMSA